MIEVDNERALHWLGVGAQPTERVQKLLEISGAWARHKIARGEVYTVPSRPETGIDEEPAAAAQPVEAAAAAETPPAPPEAAAEGSEAETPPAEASGGAGTEEE